MPAVTAFNRSRRCVWYWVHAMLKPSRLKRSPMPLFDASPFMLYSNGAIECIARVLQAMASGMRVDCAGVPTRGRSGILNLGRSIVVCGW